MVAVNAFCPRGGRGLWLQVKHWIASRETPAEGGVGSVRGTAELHQRRHLSVRARRRRWRRFPPCWSSALVLEAGEAVFEAALAEDHGEVAPGCDREQSEGREQKTLCAQLGVLGHGRRSCGLAMVVRWAARDGTLTSVVRQTGQLRAVVASVVLEAGEAFFWAALAGGAG